MNPNKIGVSGETKHTNVPEHFNGPCISRESKKSSSSLEMAAAASGKPEFYDKPSRNLHPFLFVGCWNLQGLARDKVVTAMVQKAAAENIQNIVLGGDNVYPTKEADAAIEVWKETIPKTGPKPRKHSPDVFREGIEMFKPYFVTLALGNHNVEDNIVLEVEKGYLPVKNTTYFLQEFNDATLVVFNANLLKGDEEYNVMMTWLGSVLAYLGLHGKPYYFVTHEPFGSFKKGKTTIWGIKKDKMKNAAAIEAGGTPDVLSLLQTYPPIAVLCADTHHYEDGIITGAEGTPPIRQIIVGSGGASYNTYIASSNSFSLGGPFVYEMKSAPIESYGYLSLPTKDESYFIPVLQWNYEGGGRRRSRRGARRVHKKMTRRGSR